ncbi:MAG: adenylate/guanylate cyclase domain-containing protein, partial [Thermoleophilaceae bacterium]
MAERSAVEWAEAVRDAERRGELLTAFDLAERALEEHPGDLWLRHRAVLALARAGSTDQAARRFREYGLTDVETEDVAALRARIVKDIALGGEGTERRQAAARSAELYAAIHARTGGWYPAVNAATLSLVAGDPDRAHEFAQAALDALARQGDESYYAAATEAEADLVLGRPEAARDAIARAVERTEDDYGALTTTRRQLRLVCQATGTDPAVLAPLAGPSVVHFCGHRIGAPGERARLPAEAEPQLAAAVAAELERAPVGYAYGALAAGADILWAEALLEHGGELHVVLPLALEEFVRASVEPAGAAWVERFHRCLYAATTVEYATDDALGGDDVLFRYGSELAMGLALLRARFLDAEVRQLGVWDGGGTHGEAGTAIDIATWRRGGRPTTAIDPAGQRSEVAGTIPAPIPESPAERVVRALLFADIRGFSKLADEQYPCFDENVTAAFARVLDQAEGVATVNTWGDALHVVLDDAVAAARCALGLQDAMSSVDLRAAGLPEHLALRLGAHLGPVLPSFDPVRRVPTFTGSHVSRTARIEPVTPPEAIYVTSAFAAALLLGGHEELACDYVGHMPAAKDWGRLRMYRLRR